MGWKIVDSSEFCPYKNPGRDSYDGERCGLSIKNGIPMKLCTAASCPLRVPLRSEAKNMLIELNAAIHSKDYQRIRRAAAKIEDALTGKGGR